MIWNRTILLLTTLPVLLAWGVARCDDEQTSKKSKKERIKNLELEVGAFKTAAESLQSEMDKIRGENEFLRNAIEELSELFGERHYPDLLGQMAMDVEATKDLRDKPSRFTDHFIRSVQGNLVIDNTTKYNFYVVVNGNRHEVPKRQTGSKAVSIPVPLGKVQPQFYYLPDGTPPGQPGVAMMTTPRIWGDETTNSKWKVAPDKDGKIKLMLPLKISLPGQEDKRSSPDQEEEQRGGASDQ